MKTPFKLRSGNKSSFKDMGSSPVKQKPGGIVGEAVDHWQKYKAKKKAFKEFDKWHKTLEKSDRYYRENPQYKKPVKDLISKKPSGNIAQAFKTTAGKVLGGLGVAATLYDFYKSGQKHSGGKAVKGQKTGVVAPDPKKSIFKKKDRY